MSVDARGRIMGGDPRYGRICECGNLKGWQARTCRECYDRARRDRRYWERRTCVCGAAKSRTAEKCLDCEHAARKGQPAVGRRQPADHPWRQAA